jgi:hypothetical protein
MTGTSSSPVPMPTVALLLFSRNDLEAALTLVRAIRGLVDEVVLVDSSDPAQIAARTDDLEVLSVRTYRTLPTGYVDVLVPYGVSRVVSDWTLRMDTDEELSPGLRSRLRTVGSHDAYVLPRWERDLGVFTPQLRLFRTRAYVPAPMAFLDPEIRGTVGTLPSDAFLIHRAPYGSFLDSHVRGARYLNVESYERPFNGRFAQEALTIRARRREVVLPGGRDAGSRPDAPVSFAASRFLLELDPLLGLLRTGSVRFSRFQRRYGLARWRFVHALDDSEQRRRLETSKEIRAAGGMSRYLGFDDFDYLDRLREEFDWTIGGPELLERLLRYRHDFHRRTPNLREIGIGPERSVGR